MRNQTASSLTFFLFFAAIQAACAQMPGQSIPDQPVITVSQSEDGLRAIVGEEHLAISIYGE
jgi:hypothetical protein